MPEQPVPSWDADARSTLGRALSAAGDARAVSEAVAAHLAVDGAVLVSVYLWQGRRLRCTAGRGYWQVFDGFPGGAGVIGRSCTTGERLVVHAGEDPDYLVAVAGVVDELCVPLRVGGRVVGAVNVETLAPLSAATERETDACAALLEGALARVALPEESPVQRLGDLAAELLMLAGRPGTALLHRAVVEGACALSGHDSALLLLVDGAGTTTARAATGPLGGALLALDQPTLDDVGHWVAPGTSSYTVGPPGGAPSRLRDLGVASLVVLPLHVGDARLGVLLLVSTSVAPLRAGDMELLEVLAGQVSSCLQVGAAVQHLREQAARDPLTGVGHHASFYGALPDLRRRPTSRRTAVVYLDVDHFKAVNDSLGHVEGDRLLRAVTRCMGDALRAGDELFRLGGDEFAALLPVSDEGEAVAVGERLLSAVRRELGVGMSAGVAVDQPGEDDRELVARADRALYLAKQAGRGRLHLLPGTPP